MSLKIRILPFRKKGRSKSDWLTVRDFFRTGAISVCLTVSVDVIQFIIKTSSMNYISVKESAGKAVIFSFVMMLLFSAGAIAQTPMQQPQQQQQVKTDFDRQELEEFVDVYVASTEIQQGNEEVMIQAIEEEDRGPGYQSVQRNFNRSSKPAKC